jgi:hypothetical protein
MRSNDKENKANWGKLSHIRGIKSILSYIFETAVIDLDSLPETEYITAQNSFFGNFLSWFSWYAPPTIKNASFD